MDFTGSSSDDIFTGGSANDSAVGNGGADSLSGGDGADNLAGGAGADSLNGGAGDDLLFSGDRSPPFNHPYYGNAYTPPLLDTGASRDTLAGGDGSDRLFAGYGDNVDGGQNSVYGDYLYISFLGAPSGVTVDFRLPSQVIGGGTITGIENISWIQGSDFNDDIIAEGNGVGYSDFTAVFGMGGDDRLVAGYYTGLLDGGAGNDTVDGRGSQYLQLVSGGAGADTLYTGVGLGGEADGGDGADVIYSNGRTHGGAGDDLIVLQWSYYPGLVSGDDGDDEIRASDVGHAIEGGAGADTLIGANGQDQLASAGLTLGLLTPVDDVGLERDSLAGGGGDDRLSAGYGDTVDGGGGADKLWLSLGGLTAGVTFDSAGVTSGPYVLGGATIQNIETLAYLRGTDFSDVLRLATEATLLEVDAGAGDDVVYSSASSVSLKGGAGNDRFVSGLAGDVFDGGDGLDTIDYSAAASGVTINLASGTGPGGDQLVAVENAIGSSSNDSLAGNAGANALTGGAGNDSFSGDAGDDLLDGGGGVDDVSYAAAMGGIAVNLTLTSAQAIGGGMGADRLVDVENLIGSIYNDSLTGNGSANLLTGGSGDDVLGGGDGDDVLAGGAGTDTASYATAPSGVSVSLLAVGAQNVGGGQGLDTLTSIENLTGGAFNDTLVGDSVANIIGGGAGNDSLHGGAGDDSLYGGAGADSLTGDAGFDLVSYEGAASGVTLSLANPARNTGDATGDTYSGIEWLIGSSHNDNLYGDAAANRLSGGAGHDNLSGGAGADDLDGGAGFDYARYDDQAYAGFVVSLADAGRNTGVAGGDTLAGIEGVVASYGNDTVYGDAGGNYLYGLAGNDYLFGGAGADYLDGGAGLDYARYDDQAYAGFTVSLADPGRNTGAAAGDTLVQIEGIVASSGNDWIYGDAGANYLYGMAGHDNLLGGAGADYLHGGAGFDYARYDDQAYAGFTVSLADPGRNTGVAAGDSLVQIEGIVASSGADNLYGDSAANYLYGMGGHDNLFGGAGADYLHGGAGFDYARYDDQAHGGFTLSLTNPAASTGPAAGDVFVELEGFILGGGADSFVGDGASHYVYGLSGADTLVGGGGQDFLYGGAGGDRFVFVQLGDSTVAAADRIGDYGAAAGDVLDLSAIDADSAAAGDQAFSLVAAFTGAAGQAVLTYDAGAAVTRLTLDVNGDSAADFAVVLSGQVTGVAGWAL